MSQTQPPRAPAFFGGAKRSWGTSSEEETEELLKIAAQLGKAPPFKRTRLNPPPEKTPINTVFNARPLQAARFEREYHEVDKEGKLVDPQDIALARESEAVRQRETYKKMPKPSMIEGDVVIHEEWCCRPSVDGGIIEFKVARQAKDGFPKQWVLFRLRRKIILDNLYIINDVLAMAEEDGMAPPGFGLTFSEDKYRYPKLIIDNEDETPEHWHLMCHVLLLFFRHDYKALTWHWDDVGRLLELARKYECFTLRRAAVCSLSHVFPTNFENFKHRRTHAYESKCIGQPIYWAAEALLRYALPYRLYELLPVIRLEVAAQYTMEQLLLGWPENGGRPAMQLPEDELDRILRGQEALSHMRKLHTLAPLVNISRAFPINHQCTHMNEGYKCHHALVLYVERLLANKEVWGPKYALQSIDGRSSRLLRSFVCSKCFGGLKVDLAKAQREAWKMIPTIFGMGSWFDVQRRSEWYRRNDYEWWLTVEKTERDKDMARGQDGMLRTEEDIKEEGKWQHSNHWAGEILPDLEYIEHIVTLERTALQIQAEAPAHALLALVHHQPQPTTTVEAVDVEGFVTGVVHPGNPNFTIINEQAGFDLPGAAPAAGAPPAANVNPWPGAVEPVEPEVQVVVWAAEGNEDAEEEEEEEEEAE